MKARYDIDHPEVYILIKCNGCNTDHIFEHKRWHFNGDLNKPTFTPSVKITWPQWSEEQQTQKENCCHFNITDGMIMYHGDCTHALAGQTMELPEMEINQ